MTDEQINAAIAKQCGWTVELSYMQSGIDVIRDGNRKPLPDYCNDLNAMHDAEKNLFPAYATVYSKKLATTTDTKYSDDTEYFCATARQRAEAFLRTLGRWKE